MYDKALGFAGCQDVRHLGDGLVQRERCEATAQEELRVVLCEAVGRDVVDLGLRPHGPVQRAVGAPRPRATLVDVACAVGVDVDGVTGGAHDVGHVVE